MALTSAAAKREELGTRIGPRQANERGLRELQHEEATCKLRWLSSSTVRRLGLAGDQQHLLYGRCRIVLYIIDAIWQYAASSTVSAPSQGCRTKGLKDLLLLQCAVMLFICHGVIPQRLCSMERPNMPDGHLRNDVHRKHAAAQIRRRVRHVSTPCSVLFASPSNVRAASAASYSDTAGLPMLGRNQILDTVQCSC